MGCRENLKPPQHICLKVTLTSSLAATPTCKAGEGWEKVGGVAGGGGRGKVGGREVRMESKDRCRTNRFGHGMFSLAIYSII